MGTEISNKFALIVNGDQEPRHLDNVDRAVAAFRREGPYEISVLSPEKPSAPVEHYSEASDAGLDRLLSGLGKRLSGQDLFSIYVTGHGDLDEDTGEACIALPSTCPTLDSFAQGLNALPFKRRLVVMDQCKGGDGLRPFAKPNSVVVTLGGPGENVQCQTFSPFFWSQQARDANGDGLLTIEERFRYAIEEGMPPSKPQFYQPGKDFALSGQASSKPSFDPVVLKVHHRDELQNELSRLHPGQLALVNFSAEWCRVCQEYAPRFERLAKEYGGKYLMIRAELIEGNEAEWVDYGISQVPTVAFIDSRGQVSLVKNRDRPEESLLEAVASKVTSGGVENYTSPYYFNPWPMQIVYNDGWAFPPLVANLLTPQEVPWVKRFLALFKTDRPFKQVWDSQFQNIFKAAPWMTGMTFVTSALMDGASRLLNFPYLTKESLFNPIVASASTMTLYYGATRKAALAPLLAPIVNPQASLSLTAAKAAGPLGLAGQAANTAGLIVLGNLLTGLGKEAMFHFAGADAEKDPALYFEKMVYEKELQSLSTDLFGEQVGSYIDLGLGHLLDGILTGAELVSDQVQKGREVCRERIRNSWLRSTRSMAQMILESLKMIAQHSVDSATNTIDWQTAEMLFNALMMEYGPALGPYLHQARFTQHLVPEARKVNRLLGTRQGIQDREAWQELLLEISE